MTPNSLTESDRRPRLHFRETGTLRGVRVLSSYHLHELILLADSFLLF